MAKKRSSSHLVQSSDEHNCLDNDYKPFAKRKRSNNTHVAAQRVPFASKSINTSSSGGPSVKPAISTSFTNRGRNSLYQGQENIGVACPAEHDDEGEEVKKEEDFVENSPVGLSRERDIFAEELSPSVFAELDLDLKKGVSNDRELFEWLELRGFLTPKLLHALSQTPISSLHLTPSLKAYCSHEKPATLLFQPLFEKSVYVELQFLNLSRSSLINDDVSLLRLLPNLRELNLSYTGITTEALHHIVCHRHTLEILDVSSNQGINDDLCVPLKAMIKLSSLALAGTSLSMFGLRRLADECCARYLSIPSGCLDYLNSRYTQYAIEIPQNLKADPKSVDVLTLPFLKQNLELHRKNNPQICVTGSKVELVTRLKGILSKRLTDEKVARAIIQAS